MALRYLSAIDMGTNSFRLIIVRVYENGQFKVIDKEKELIRLAGHEGKGLSIITESETKTAVKAIKKFKALSDFYHAKLRAVATSAVRESHNRAEFIKEIKEKTGVDVEVIDGKKEAELIYKGIGYAIPVVDKKVVCFDIGGGSTEFILGNKGKVEFAESVKIGAVRLTKKFFPDFVINKFSVDKCSEYIEEQILSNNKIKFNCKTDFAIGSSGTILSTTNLIYYLKHGKLKKNLNSTIFTRDELFEVIDLVLSKHTLNERLRVKGLEKKRADILPAGLLILMKIFELFKLESMTVSENALRSGIIMEMLDKVPPQMILL